jgi:hypothetical protein
MSKDFKNHKVSAPSKSLVKSTKKTLESDSKKKGHIVKNLPLRLTNHAKLHMLRQLKVRKIALDGVLAANTAAAPPKGWSFLGDSKSAPSGPDVVKLMQEAYDSELKMVRSVLGGMMGSKPIPFMLPVLIQFSTTVTTGVVNAVYSIVVTDSTEWTSLAALFDEYRFVSGRYDFVIITPTVTAILGTSALSTGSNASIGYDPTDATSATSPNNILQLEQHKQWFPRIVPTATAGTYVGVYGSQNNRPFSFSWKTGQFAELTGNGGAVGPGMWKSTAGNVSTFPDGAIKPYYASGETTVKECYQGTMYWDVHFRSRT